MIFAPGGPNQMPFPFPGMNAPGGMGPRLFPDFKPGPSSIDTTYGADGSVQTRTQAPGMPMSSGPYQQLYGMMSGNFSKKKPKSGLGRSSTARPTMDGPREGGMLKTVDTPWYSQQGAAMRPIGLGPAQIPGMGIDQRFLPPGMRADKSELKPSDRVENSASGGNPAGLSPAGPSAQQQANALLGGNSDQSISGINYMSPAEQARWRAAAARSAGN